MIDFYGLVEIDARWLVIAVLVVLVLALTSFIVAIVAICKMNKTRKAYDNFMSGKDGRTLEPLLLERFAEIENLKLVNAKNVKNIKFLLDKIHYSYQKVGIVKYDAFHEMGGKLSYALTMLDNKNNGFIINSMHSREGCYTYIKEIVAGESYIELGTEEAESLKKALAGPLGDPDLGHMNEVINNSYNPEELDEALEQLNLSKKEMEQVEELASKDVEEYEKKSAGNPGKDKQ